MNQPALAWREKAPSKCVALRALLADLEWHHMTELRRVGGWRYGARLLELRTGEDGGAPLGIEKMVTAPDEWLYRSTGEVAVPQRKWTRLDELTEENARLKARITELEARP